MVVMKDASFARASPASKCVSPFCVGKPTRSTCARWYGKKTYRPSDNANALAALMVMLTSSNARAETRAAEEQTRAEARAAEERARAEALVLAARAATAPLTEEETAALDAEGQVGESARRALVARTVDADLVTEGPAGTAKVELRQRNRGHAQASRKRKKEKGEALAREEAELTERAAGLLVDLKRGGSTVLDDDGTGAFPEDEERIKALLAARDREQDKKERKNLGDKVRRARQALASKVLQRRVPLLETRVAELEKELRARAASHLPGRLCEPRRRPLPHIPQHVVEAGAVGLVRVGGRDAAVPVERRVRPREVALPHVEPPRALIPWDLVAPRVELHRAGRQPDVRLARRVPGGGEVEGAASGGRAEGAPSGGENCAALATHSHSVSVGSRLPAHLQ